MTISTRAELAALRAQHIPQFGGVRAPLPDPIARPRPEPEPEPPAAPKSWRIPPPAQGAAYSVAEVAQITGAAPASVHRWISRGVSARVPGERVRLRTLRVPRGRITPEALCAFLSAANGVQVTVQE